MPIGAAGAKNFQKSTFLKQKNINFSRPGEGVITPFTPKVVPALSLGVNENQLYRNYYLSKIIPNFSNHIWSELFKNNYKINKMKKKEMKQ